MCAHTIGLTISRADTQSVQSHLIPYSTVHRTHTHTVQQKPEQTQARIGVVARGRSGRRHRAQVGQTGVRWHRGRRRHHRIHLHLVCGPVRADAAVAARHCRRRAGLCVSDCCSHGVPAGPLDRFAGEALRERLRRDLRGTDARVRRLPSAVRRQGGEVDQGMCVFGFNAKLEYQMLPK